AAPDHQPERLRRFWRGAHASCHRTSADGPSGRRTPPMPNGGGMRRPTTGWRGRSIRRLLAVILGLVAVAYLTGPPATAQTLPSPRDLVSNISLECFTTSPYEPPRATLQLRHLNPVLARVSIGEVVLGPREQFCAPVLSDQPGIIP